LLAPATTGEAYLSLRLLFWLRLGNSNKFDFARLAQNLSLVTYHLSLVT